MADSPSFERINYSVRPAKATERHMLLDAVGRLSPFGSLRDYLYVGFGSTFFIDFKQVHQRFGMRRLYSIEQEHRKKARFEFNRPLACIQMLYGPSKSKLLDPRLLWNEAPAIVWLDYDKGLDLEKLADCERVLSKAKHGTMLIVTVSVRAGDLDGRAERWRSAMGSWVPFAETNNTLDATRVSDICFDALTENAEKVLEDARPGWKFEQLFRLRYSDTTPMATWGGVLLEDGQPGRFKDCRFGELSFVRRKGRPTYHLQVPNLTPPERALVEGLLPGRLRGARAQLRKHAIPESEADSLREVYRYAPRFVETFA